MKIYNGDTLVTNSKLKIENLLLPQEAGMEDFLLIEYESKSLLKEINSLILDTARITQPIWKCPDFNNAKTYICVSPTDYDLSIEIFPAKYSMLERQELLGVGNNKISRFGVNSCDYWEEVFFESDRFYSQANAQGEIWTYKLELSNTELMQLESFIKRF